MSSLQLYEFQSLDAALDKKDRAYLEGLSSRADVDATSARYVYNYGDFRADPIDVLERCFDIALYQCSYGFRQFAIRLPAELVNPADYEPYCVPHLISIQKTQKSVIIDIAINSERFNDWLEEAFRLPELQEIRDNVLKGDLRVLYLAWLATAYSEECSLKWDKTIEPPIPPNLKKLSPALEAFAEIFEIDDEVLAVAAAESETISRKQTEVEPVEVWIASLSEQEKNQYLLRVAQGETHIGLALMTALRQRFGHKSDTQWLKGTPGHRTYSQLEAAVLTQKEEKEQRAIAAFEQAEQKRLSALVPKVDQLLGQVRTLVNQGNVKAYDKAIAHLLDLKEIAIVQDELETFELQLKTTQTTYSRKRAFISRLKAAELI